MKWKIALALFALFEFAPRFPAPAQAADQILDSMNPPQIGQGEGSVGWVATAELLGINLPPLLTAQLSADSAEKVEGSHSLSIQTLITAGLLSPVLSETVYKNLAAAEDWSGYRSLSFFVKADSVLAAALSLGASEFTLASGLDLTGSAVTYELDASFIDLDLALLHAGQWTPVVIDLTKNGSITPPASVRSLGLVLGTTGLPVLTANLLTEVNLDAFKVQVPDPTASPSPSPDPETCLKMADTDGDGNQEQACDTDGDGCYGDVYVDPDGSSSACINIDGNNDGCADFFIDTDKSGCVLECPEVFWDPTQGILNDISEVDLDVDGDNDPDQVCAYDSDDDGDDDSFVDPDPQNPDDSGVGGEGGGGGNPFIQGGSGCGLAGPAVPATAMALLAMGLGVILVGMGMRMRRSPAWRKNRKSQLS
ncbi:MAG TPA: hypothetical protein VJR29_03675 [bacterium]|nr:hypothetical protein [bacterium]